MAQVDERTIANMNVVLDEAFAGVPHGGDHESRKRIAKKLLQSAKKGNVTLDGLRAVAREALHQLPTRKNRRDCSGHDAGLPRSVRIAQRFPDFDAGSG
jgi:hypothetical protein